MNDNHGSLVGTICCREKDHSPGLLPASRRYLSGRIRRVFQLARDSGLEFFILSGRFGPISPDEPIPYYDQLLQESEVEEMSGLVADYLGKEKAGKVIFFSPDPERDPHVIPYLKSIKRGARKAGVSLEVITVPPYPENLALASPGQLLTANPASLHELFNRGLSGLKKKIP